jgi:peptidase E
MMQGKKPVYLLAGGRPRDRGTTDLLIRGVFKESAKVSPTIAYVGTANGDNEDFFNRMAEMYKEAGAYRVNHALISPDTADLTKAKDVLESADIIFISGGDVDRGMRVLREKNMIDFLSTLYQQGKPFFGSSAGAIMLAKEWVRWRDPEDNTSAELFPCLGFAPVICDCHDEEGGWQELRTAIRLEEDNAIGYGLVTGMAIKVFPDGRIEALGGAIHQYVRHGKKVYRAPDVLPVSDKY